MGKHLVFVGAGHAHLTAIANLSRYLDDGHRVTVINTSSYQYYSGMAPGMLAGLYTPQEVRFNVRKLTEDRKGRFIEDTVKIVDPAMRTVYLRNGEPVTYDVLSFNTGSEIDTGPLDTSFENIYKVKPVANMFKARCDIVKALNNGPLDIVVMGGGPAGVEMAGNSLRMAGGMKNDINVTIVSRGNLLHRFAPKARNRVMKNFRERGIKVEENTPVKSNTSKKVLLENGSKIPFDFAFVATGTRPSDLYQESGIPYGEDGGLLVNQHLQSVKYSEIFGGGDCISFAPQPLDRVGVYAVRENPLLLHNLHVALSGGVFKSFEPQEIYVLIFNLGDGTAVYTRKSLNFGGKFAFWLKDRIDRKFMKKFQLSGELTEAAECQS